MKHEDLGSMGQAEGLCEIAALPVFDDAVPAAERRAFEREGASRRKGARVELEGTVRLRGAAQGAVDAVIFNLSAGGCALKLPCGGFVDGDLVTVKIDGVENWPGSLKWCAGDDAGIAFDRPFYPAVFEAIIAMHDAGRATRRTDRMPNF